MRPRSGSPRPRTSLVVRGNYTKDLILNLCALHTLQSCTLSTKIGVDFRICLYHKFNLILNLSHRLLDLASTVVDDMTPSHTRDGPYRRWGEN